jgi:death-on-curing protein
MNIQYLSIDEILVLHKKLIDEFGGHHGVRDPGALESALIRPQLGYYDTIQQQAAAMIESLVNNHPFMDGNKRIAFFGTDVFLRLNGYFLDCDSEPTYAHWIYLFENHQFQFDFLFVWLDSVCRPLGT